MLEKERVEKSEPRRASRKGRAENDVLKTEGRARSARPIPRQFRSSRFALLGSQFSARSSRLALLGSLFFSPRSSAPFLTAPSPPGTLGLCGVRCGAALPVHSSICLLVRASLSSGASSPLTDSEETPPIDTGLDKLTPQRIWPPCPGPASAADFRRRLGISRRSSFTTSSSRRRSESSIVSCRSSPRLRPRSLEGGQAASDC